MDNKIFEKAFKELLNGKSMRKIAEEYDIDRNEFKEECKKRFPENSEERKKLEQILSYNKANSTTKPVDEEEIEPNIEKILNGELTINQVAKIMNLHKQTLNEKIVEYINKSDDLELKQKFVEYQKRKHPDYSFINFKALIIEMIEKDLSQTEIAKKYGIPARTVSREIEKMKSDEAYLPLYKIAKEHSNRKMTKRKFDAFESYLIDEILESYNEKEVIIDVIPKRESEYKKLKEMLKKAEKIKGTQAQKAEELGISVSTLRRIEKQIEKYEIEEKKEIEIEKGE